MNEFYLNSPSGKLPAPSRTEKENSAPKNAENPDTHSESFKEILKSAVRKSDGSTKIRQDLVKKYKSTLADGTYEVKARELAEKMVQKIRENKERTII